MNRTILENETGYRMTEHAMCNAQQRGISSKMILAVISHGDKELHAGGGLFSLRISQKKCVEFNDCKTSIPNIDQINNLVLVIHPDKKIIITVLHDYGSKAGRCYRSQWPTRNRKRTGGLREERKIMAATHNQKTSQTGEAI